MFSRYYILVFQNMVDKLELYYHLIVLLAFFSGTVWQLLNMKEVPPDDLFITDMMEYTERYFTLWNAVIQCSYFALATIEDLNENKSGKSLVTRLKPYILYSWVIPCAGTVFMVFWGLFHYDRELIYPKSADYFCMNYSNHIFHTAIIIFPILELFFMSNHPEVSFRSCFISVTILHVIYDTVFLHHYLTVGRSLYPVFQILTVYQKAALLLAVYTTGLSSAKLGITIPKYVRRVKLGLTSWKNVKIL